MLLEEIDVVLYYVVDDLVICGDRVYFEEEFFYCWSVVCVVC